MKGAVSFLISAMNHSPKGRQKTDTGVGVRNRAAMGVGLRSLLWCCQRLGRVGIRRQEGCPKGLGWELALAGI